MVQDVRNKMPGGSSKRNVSQITKIARHHSATNSGNAESFASYHTNTLGWSTSGYHEVILRDGTVQKAYADNVITNGVGDHNTGTYHICVVGNSNFTSKQEKAFEERAKAAMERFNLKVSDVLGHNEFADTSRYKHSTNTCPGISMNAVRNKLSGSSGGSSSGSSSSTSSWNNMSNSQKYADATKAISDAGLTVKQYQQRLINAGHNLPRFGADGHFGGETLTATKAFQRTHELSSPSGNFYGRPGPATIKKLREVSSSGKKQVHLPSTANTWRTYKLNVQPVKKNSDWSLTPAAFGGLTYDILDEPYPGVVTINTGRGKRNIFVKGTSATIS
ncbi:N-acetylmuramoyl-L-alanine amidase [Virgibacillus oceani]